MCMTTGKRLESMNVISVIVILCCKNVITLHKCFDYYFYYITKGFCFHKGFDDISITPQIFCFDYKKSVVFLRKGLNLRQ